MTHKQPLLMYADTEHDADMLYAVGMFVPDPFIYLRKGKHAWVVMSDLEIDRARRLLKRCRVVSLTRLHNELKKAGITHPGPAEIIMRLLKRLKIDSVWVPYNFPVGLAEQIRQYGIRVQILEPPTFPERECKSAAEVKKIEASLAMAEVGMGEAIQVLRQARIGSGNRLYYGGSLLTAERLRAIIETVIVQADGIATHTIVACGELGCDPHEVGHGPLYAHKPIIIDIFPRSQKTGYYGDITRTVVKGRASDAVRKIYMTVQQAQKKAIEMMRVGTPTADIHSAVVEFFNLQGFKTTQEHGRMQGFFHGTGHGLGLEVHESPRIGPNSSGKLKPGHVVTVEPGLYYSGIGGVRLEDVVWIRPRGNQILTRFEKVLEV